jgi:transposase InsO family protein
MTAISIPVDRQWLTAAEAAEERLPGLPSTKRQMNRIISAGIKTRKRDGRGGGREFHWTDLPSAEAQGAYLKRYGQQAPAQIERKRTVGGKELLAEARELIASAARDYIAAHKLDAGAGLKAFSEAYETRQLAIEPWVFNVVPAVQPHQVRVWQRKLKKGCGFVALVDQRGRPTGSAIDADPELRNFIAAQLGARPGLSCTALRKAIALPPEKNGLGRDIPLRSLQRFAAPLRPNKNALMKAAAHPDAFRSHHRASLGSRSQHVTMINQLWEMDATRGDCMCLVPGEIKPRRVSLTMIIDVFTRRATVVVSDQPSADASRAAIRRACLAWGMPAVLKTDNGKEFKNRAVARFCAEAGIALDFCRPFHPEDKPHVERMFGTMLHELFEQLDGYVGHNVAQRQAIESRNSFAHRFGQEGRVLFEVQLSPADLQARIDAWLAHVYEERPHGSMGLSPRNKALAHADQARTVSDERALDALMMDAEPRTISKGVISLNRRSYGSPETGALEVTVPNRKVQVRVDPLDPSWIAIYSADGEEFLCIAHDLDLLDPQERQRVAVQALKNQNKVVTLFRAQLRGSAPVTHRLADRLIAHAMTEPSLVLNEQAARGMVAASSTKLLQHAAMADARAQASTPDAPIAVSAEERAAAQTVIASLERRQTRVVVMVQCTGYERPYFDEDDLGFWHWARERIASGLGIDAQDREELTRLERSPAFQHQLELADAKRAAMSA